MAGIDLATAQTKLDFWLEVDANGGAAKSGSSSGRAVTYHDPDQVRRNIEYWNRKVQALSRGSGVSATRMVVND